MRVRAPLRAPRFVLDFYAPGPRLAVEVDGPIHDVQRARDHERDAWLAAVGVRTLRFTNDAVVNDLAAVLARISAALEPGISLPEGPEGQGQGWGRSEPAQRDDLAAPLRDPV